MSDERLVADLDRAWNDAYLSYRREWLRDVLAEDWVGVLANGQKVTREELIAASPPHDLQVNLTFSEFSLHLFGDTAVTTGRLDISGDENVRQQFMRVYAKRYGRWWAVATHVLPILDQL